MSPFSGSVCAPYKARQWAPRYIRASPCLARPGWPIFSAQLVRPDFYVRVNRRTTGCSESGVVLAREADRPALLLPPARTASLIPAVATRGGVEPLARDHHVGVAGVAEDGDPAAVAGDSPARGQGARGHRAGQQARGVQDVAHGTRAVIPAVVESPVTPAPDIGEGVNRVRRGNRSLDLCGRVRGSNR